MTARLAAAAAAIAIACVACGGAGAQPQAPAATAATTADAAVAVAVTPDAAPDAGVPDAVTAAPAWIFRYHTADRSETWTLRYADGHALLVVDSARGAMRYLGTADDTGELALDVSTGSAKLALHCKHTQRRLSHKCNDAKAKPIDVLDCYHPDFKEPMPFGHEPGVEYTVDDTAPPAGRGRAATVDASCTGYRVIAP